MCFRLEYLHLIFAHSKGQVKLMHITIANIAYMVTYRANFAITKIYIHIWAFDSHIYV